MIDVRCDEPDKEEEDRRDATDAARPLAGPPEVPIPYEQARQILGLDAADIEALVAPVTTPGLGRETEVDAEGWVWDPATGEVLRLEGVEDRFRVDSTAAAEWALEVRSRIEGEIAALDARLEALRENLLALRRVHVRRLAWWEWRFGSQVVDFARRALAGGKGRTWTCAWGRVSFRKSKGRHEILDMDAAVEFVAGTRPELVKVVRTVGVQDVEKALAWLGAHVGEEPERPGWLKSTGESETCKIDTGIYVKKETTNDTKHTNERDEERRN